jgi:hypothetical protein
MLNIVDKAEPLNGDTNNEQFLGGILTTKLNPVYEGI